MLAPGIANADKSESFYGCGEGFCHFLKTEDMSDSDIAAVVAAYERHQGTGKKADKKGKVCTGSFLSFFGRNRGYAFAPMACAYTEDNSLQIRPGLLHF